MYEGCNHFSDLFSDIGHSGMHSVVTYEECFHAEHSHQVLRLNNKTNQQLFVYGTGNVNDVGN